MLQPIQRKFLYRAVALIVFFSDTPAGFVYMFWLDICCGLDGY